MMMMNGVECRPKRYGNRCRERCNCPRGLRCHHVTGDCVECPPGFAPPACTKRTTTLLYIYDYSLLPPPPICENAHQVTPLVLWFFRQPIQRRPLHRFTVNTSNDVVSRKDVPFGGLENKIFYFDPIFPQKKQKFYAIFRQDFENYGSKRP